MLIRVHNDVIMLNNQDRVIFLVMHHFHQHLISSIMTYFDKFYGLTAEQPARLSVGLIYLDMTENLNRMCVIQTDSPGNSNLIDGIPWY